MPSDFVINLFAGASAGAVGKIACHPIDTCKSQVQSGRGAVTSAMQAFRSTLAQGGVSGLYRGIGAVLVGGTPATMIYLTSYEYIKKEVMERWKGIPEFAVYFWGGMAAEAISCIMFVPVDVVKERMQVYQPHTTSLGANNDMLYRNSWDSFTSIIRTEGLAGIYKGYGATLMSFGPYSALYFVGYEYCRTQLSASLKKDVKDLGFMEVLACSATSGSIASYITTPLDLVKLRMQIDRGRERSGHSRHGMVPMLREVLRRQGVAGLFKGSMARVVAYTPCVAISMAVFESCKTFWAKLLPST